MFKFLKNNKNLKIKSLTEENNHLKQTINRKTLYNKFISKEHKKTIKNLCIFIVNNFQIIDSENIIYKSDNSKVSVEQIINLFNKYDKDK